MSAPGGRHLKYRAWGHEWRVFTVLENIWFFRPWK